MTEHQTAPVGVVASSLPVANAIIRDLGLKNAIALSRRISTIAGMRLGAVIIHETAHPLPDHYEAELTYTLRKTGNTGHIYGLERRR